jgi:hypothetical protein
MPQSAAMLTGFTTVPCNVRDIRKVPNSWTARSIANMTNRTRRASEPLCSHTCAVLRAITHVVHCAVAYAIE